MSDTRQQFQLTSNPADAPPILLGVTAEGRIEGELLEMSVAQRYVNDGSQALEVTYTFPLPHDATLLSFTAASESGQWHAVVAAPEAAAKDYETAIRDGAAPVMLETRVPGIYSVSIGRLSPGQQLTLSVRFAVPLRFDVDRLQVTVPTTIAPRYGNAVHQGLQPEQVPELSLVDHYPLSLKLTVGASWKDATVSCPTHRSIIRRTSDDEQVLELSSGAALDRDVVVLLQPPSAPTSQWYLAADPLNPDAPVVAMALLRPAAQPGANAAAIALQTLIDCSSSMAGDSIDMARSAARQLGSTLRAGDWFSLTTFGNGVEDVVPPRPADDAPDPAREVADVRASSGGTELGQALTHVLDQAFPASAPRVDLLLITDGDVWNVEAVAAAAREGGRRIFVLGVGSAPATSLLRLLAESTGGACEFAHRNEMVEPALQRLLRRVRQTAWQHPRIDWGAQPVWQTNLDSSVFGGDTLIAFAGFTSLPANTPLQLTASEPSGGLRAVVTTKDRIWIQSDVLPRIAATRRLQDCGGEPGRDLALRYQLVSPQTRAVLVMANDQDERPLDELVWRRVCGMLAAGWGATGTVSSSRLEDPTPRLLRRPIEDPASLPSDAASHDLLFVPGQQSVFHYRPRPDAPPTGSRSPDTNTPRPPGVPPAGPRPAGTPPVPPPTLGSMVRRLNQPTDPGGEPQATLVESILDAHTALHPDVEAALVELQSMGIELPVAMALLLDWVNQRVEGPRDTAIDAVLRPITDGLPSDLVVRATRVLRHLLGHHSIDAWDD